MPAEQPWKPWSFKDVVDAELPAFALRTYLEQADVRSHLQRICLSCRLESACEVGCGYGRMTVVLGEFAARVSGFERQPEFAEAARRLHPNFTIFRVESLGALPAPGRSFDLVMTFTVLQHLTDRVLAAVAAEIKRLVRPSGFVLLCEDTNPASRFGDVDNDAGMCVIGRTPAAYASLLTPLRLLSAEPRRVEPTYPSRDVGTYMLFQAPAALT